MGVVNYTVANCEVLAENRDSVRRWYVPDPLGSTLALLDNTQAKTDTFTYWPYGEVKTRTGTTATPFQYMAGHEYYRDSSTLLFVSPGTWNVRLARLLRRDAPHLERDIGARGIN